MATSTGVAAVATPVSSATPIPLARTCRTCTDRAVVGGATPISATMTVHRKTATVRPPRPRHRRPRPLRSRARLHGASARAARIWQTTATVATAGTQHAATATVTTTVTPRAAARLWAGAHLAMAMATLPRAAPSQHHHHHRPAHLMSSAVAPTSAATLPTIAVPLVLRHGRAASQATWSVPVAVRLMLHACQPME